MTSRLRQPDYRAFVDHLVELRQSMSVTQQELAERLSKPQSWVSKYERGERRLDPAEFREVVIALGGDPARAFQLIHDGLV
jgi:transcriptional regulator with XRE-family HTH domain